MIYQASKTEHGFLTDIAFEAKRHWRYPEESIEKWEEELTIHESYIKDNIVYIAKKENGIIGFYSITENQNEFYVGEVFVQKGFWLEHIFIKPEFHKQGIGRLLIDHVKSICKNKGIERLLIFVDPFARGFYDKIGAEFLYDSKSSIPGRNIPVYSLFII